jgi:ribosomal protein S18 acetylase RimI-like enzyme
MTVPKANVTVRRMTADDIDAIIKLGGNIISRHELTALGLEGPLDCSFVAEVDGNIIGFNLARLQYVGIPLTRVCLIHGIVVQHEYRRHGIGNRLVEEMFRCCHELGVDTIRAHVEQSDLRLQRFITQLGFFRSTVDNYDKNVGDES